MKTLHPDTLAKLKTDHLRALLVKFDFTPTPVCLTNFAVDIAYSGDIYLANGKLQKLRKLKQSLDLRVANTDIELDAIEPSLVAILRSQPQHGRNVDIYQVILNDDYSIAGEPIQLQRMIINGPPKVTNDPSKGEAVIKQKTSSEFANWSQKAGRTTTPDSQHREFPNDTGFDYAAESGVERPWGRK